MNGRPPLKFILTSDLHVLIMCGCLCINIFIIFTNQIAAASLEKLFQQLTNPLNTNREFLETFFMTYRLFTTAEDVLTALINCLLQKNDGSKNRVSMFVSVFVFVVPYIYCEMEKFCGFHRSISNCKSSSEMIA